jgi:acetoin utilization protein AcuB/CBS domain-containing protein
MRVFEVMTDGVQTVKPDVTASEARDRMRRSQIHHLVVMQGSTLVGIVSDHDLGGARLSRAVAAQKVSDLMTTPAVAVTATTLVTKAANLMRGRSIGSLVVTAANGKVAGIVTVSDLLELVGRGAGRQPHRLARPTLSRDRKRRAINPNEPRPKR